MGYTGAGRQEGRVRAAQTVTRLPKGRAPEGRRAGCKARYPTAERTLGPCACTCVFASVPALDSTRPARVSCVAPPPLAAHSLGHVPEHVHRVAAVAAVAVALERRAVEQRLARQHHIRRLTLLHDLQAARCGVRACVRQGERQACGQRRRGRQTRTRIRYRGVHAAPTMQTNA